MFKSIRLANFTMCICRAFGYGRRFDKIRRSTRQARAERWRTPAIDVPCYKDQNTAEISPATRLMSRPTTAAAARGRDIIRSD